MLVWKQLQNFCLPLVNTSSVRTVNITVCHCVQYTVWNQGIENFHITYDSWISGIKTNMLLIVLLGLIVRITLVSGECGIGTMKLRNFNWTKVCAIVLTCLINKQQLIVLLVLCFIRISVKIYQNVISSY
jgi:hypothetical protein